jgi:glycosyltransferase involved in cell wall biosynthesis
MTSKAESKNRWLVIAEGVSSYSWDLFQSIEANHGIELAVIHRVPAERDRSQFLHETFQPRGVAACDYSEVSRAELVRFMRVHHVGAILVFSMRARLPLCIAFAQRRPSTPIVFASDTNVTNIIPTTLNDWGRIGAYRLVARGITEAWALGRSNEEALRLFGMRRVRSQPFLSISFSDFGPPRHAALSRRERFRLLYVGRLAPEKNTIALAEAVSSPGLRDHVELELVGDGPDRGMLEKLVAEGANNVSIVGARTHREVGDHLATADALVLPSTWEPWGLVVIEALGQGIPVLATPAVGAAVSLAGRYGGIRLFLGCSAVDLVRGVKDLLDDYESVALSASNEAFRVRAEWATEQVARRMVDAVRELQVFTAGGIIEAPCT